MGVRSLNFGAVASSESRVAAGWMLAALGQGVAIANAEDAGDGDHLAPNRRLLFELLVNLEGLNRRGQSLIDALVRKAENEEAKMIAMLGEDWSPRNKEARSTAIRADDDDDKSSDYLAAFKALAKHLGLAEGFYTAWWSETQLAHAGVRLAEEYAPLSDTGLVVSSPRSTEPDLAIVGVLIWYGVALAAEIIERDGYIQIAGELSQIIGPQYNLW